MKTSKITRVRCLAIMILVIIANNTLQASTEVQDSICRDYVIEFYKILYSGMSRECEIENKTDLCDHLSQGKIYETVRKAPVFNDGAWIRSFVEIKLSNKQTIYFQVNMIPPVEIDRVWVYHGTE